MSCIFGNGDIFLIRQAVPAVWGINKYLSTLSAGGFGFKWKGKEITLVTVNSARTICKIFTVNSVGVSLTTRKLFHSKFSLLFGDELIPNYLTKEDLELMYLAGTCDAAKNDANYV